MQVFDQSAQQALVYVAQWESANTVAEPSGGTVEDLEARAAISELIQQLERIGLVT